MPTPPRITFKSIIADIMSVWNLERGLPYTFKEFLLKPLASVQTYIFENRNQFFNPVRYVIFAFAVNFFLQFKSKPFQLYLDWSARNQQNEELMADPVMGPFMQDYMEALFNSMNILALMAIPVMSLLTFAILNGKRFTYWEHIAINSFAWGTSTIIGIIYTIPTMFINHIWPVFGGIVLSIIVITIFYRRVYEHGWLRSLLGYVLSYAIGFILTSILWALCIGLYLGIKYGMSGAFNQPLEPMILLPTFL